eukprot:1698119-Amphidinium_carterae.2
MLPSSCSGARTLQQPLKRASLFELEVIVVKAQSHQVAYLDLLEAVEAVKNLNAASSKEKKDDAGEDMEIVSELDATLAYTRKVCRIDEESLYLGPPEAPQKGTTKKLCETNGKQNGKMTNSL